MGLNFDQFSALVDEIMSQGYDEETAAHYAALIGDTPAREGGALVVFDEKHDKILARLKPLKFFGEW